MADKWRLTVQLKRDGFVVNVGRFPTFSNVTMNKGAHLSNGTEQTDFSQRKKERQKEIEV